MLFGALGNDVFMLFAGENRFLYEEVLVGIYEGCFGSDLLFPTQAELVEIIYDLLARRPELWHEEGSLIQLDAVSIRGRRLRARHRPSTDAGATSDAMSRARHIYARLLQTGWLEESRYGLKVTVDMPAGAMRLAEFLSSMRSGSAEQLGGLVIEVKNALDAVRASASQNALGLHKAAKDAVGFGRYLRSVLSMLREIDRQVVASENLNERLQHYFEDFVERVLLKDFASIATTAHPYRFRYAILEAVQALEDSTVDVENLAVAYAEARLVEVGEAARDLVFDDLDKIRRVFRRIDEAFTRIQQHRTHLEVRLRNTVRYAGRRADAYLRRSGEVVVGLDRVIGSRKDIGSASIVGPLCLVRHPYAPGLLARPRGERPIVEVSALLLRQHDPVHALRRELERDYLARITVRPEQVLSYLDARVGTSRFAKELEIYDLDDFLRFETLRRAVREMLDGKADNALSAALADRYAFSRLEGEQVDNDWLQCDDFVISRFPQPARAE